MSFSSPLGRAGGSHELTLADFTRLAGNLTSGQLIRFGGHSVTVEESHERTYDILRNTVIREIGEGGVSQIFGTFRRGEPLTKERLQIILRNAAEATGVEGAATSDSSPSGDVSGGSGTPTEVVSDESASISDESTVHHSEDEAAASNDGANAYSFWDTPGASENELARFRILSDDS